jgi:hypothetical protein
LCYLRPASVPGLVDAQCDGGALWVTPHAAIEGIDQPGGPGDYHQENIQFFYVSVRDNALDRVQAWIASPPEERTTENSTHAQGATTHWADCVDGAPAPESNCVEPGGDLPGAPAADWPGSMPRVLRP